MLLTPRAEVLAVSTREVLTLIRAKITTPLEFDPLNAERTFAIMTSDFAYDILLCKAIARAERLAPNVRFDVLPTDSSARLQLERGEIDLLVTISRLMDEDNPRIPLFQDEHALICWSDGAHKDGISFDTFVSAGHAIVYFGKNKFPAFTETFFSERGMTRRIEVKVPTFAALAPAVVGTNRIATLYRRHAEHFARSFPITVHPMPLEIEQISEDAQWHSMRDKDAGIQWLLSLLQDEVRLSL